jgi:hypothetical protein
MKKITFIFIFTLTGALFAQQNPTTLELWQNSPIQRVVHEKNPGVSFLMSMVFPGVGQMYNGQVGLGLGLMGSELVMFGVGGALIATGKGIPGFICMGIGGAIHLTGMILAPIECKRINKKIGFPSIVQNKRDDVNFQVGIGNAGPGISFSF